MITQLYIDNYKGFQKTIMEFDKVNFFVGENSTGKTAVIDLIRVLNQNNKIDFVDTEWENISFKSLISKHPNENDVSFTVIFKIINSDQKSIFKLYKVINNNNFPFISRASFQLDNGKTVHVKHEQDSFGYIIDDTSKKFDSVLDFLTYCESDFDYKTIKRFYEFREIYPFQIVENLIKRVDKEVDFSILESFFPRSYKYTGPLRHIPDVYEYDMKREHDTSGRDLLYRYISLKKYDKNISIKINKFGQRSGLYDKFDYKIIETDMPIILNTTTVTKNSIELPIKFHGTGLSQVMPIILDLHSNNDMLVSQPELHLHPKAQFELGKELFDCAFSNKNRRIFVETHSDFIIDAVREEQFILDKIFKYIEENNVKLSGKSDKTKDVKNKLIERVVEYLIEEFGFETHLSLQNTVERSLQIARMKQPNKSYISLNYFSSDKKDRVKKLIVKNDGSFDYNNIKEYREFYLDYASRGLIL